MDKPVTAPDDESTFKRKRNFMEDRARRGADRRQRWKLTAILAGVALLLLVAHALLAIPR